MPTLEAITLDFTGSGYLVVPALIARALFPGDALVVLRRDDALWLYPTRGPAGGGLLLKQRNAAGDRAVLLTEALRHAGLTDVPAGVWHAEWSAADGALRVHLPAGADA